MQNRSESWPRWSSLAAALSFAVLALSAPVHAASFAPGDVFVALRTGQVQWRHADGSLAGVLAGTVQGKTEGIGVDGAGYLYVSHYCADISVCMSGNSFERFDQNGTPLGAFGSGYNCNPYSITFAPSGNAYVGQADCSGELLEFSATGTLLRRMHPQPQNRGTAWVALAADGCTLFYTSQGANVKRYDVCFDLQRADLNAVPLAGMAHQFRVLPDGGVLVATELAVVRFDAGGILVRTYDQLGEPDLWYGVALVGDGTFWTSNYGSSSVYHFDLATGAVLGSFNVGTPTTTIKGLAVWPIP